MWRVIVLAARPFSGDAKLGAVDSGDGLAFSNATGMWVRILSPRPHLSYF